MKLDPVLKEVRKIRENYSEQFKGDVDAMIQDLHRRSEEAGHKTIRLQPKKRRSPAHLTPNES